MRTVYVSIGNSDAKLTDRQWWNFWGNVYGAINASATKVHGVWHSFSLVKEGDEHTYALMSARPTNGQRYVNACWCFELPDDQVEPLKKSLMGLAHIFKQESIAWAEAVTTFLRSADTAEGRTTWAQSSPGYEEAVAWANSGDEGETMTLEEFRNQHG